MTPRPVLKSLGSVTFLRLMETCSQSPGKPGSNTIDLRISDSSVARRRQVRSLCVMNVFQEPQFKERTLIAWVEESLDLADSLTRWM